MNTIQCNQRCTKCSHWKYKDKADRLPPQKIVSLVTSISSAEELCIVGGEPLLFKDEIFEILDGIQKTAVRTILITNGVPLDRDFVDRIANYHIHVVVSIDTMDREFWKFVRGTKSYDRVFENFEYANSVLSPAQLSIQSVLSKETESHLAGVSAYAQKQGVYHSIQDYISEGFEGSWTPLESKAVIIDNSGQQCFAADRNLSVLQNGDVFTCFQQNWIDGCQAPLGNLHVDSIEDILISEYAEFVSSKMRVCDLPCKVLKCNTA